MWAQRDAEPVNPVCNRIRIQEYVTRGLPWIVSATVIPEEISPESYDNYDSDVDGDAQDGASVFLASLAIAHETYGRRVKCPVKREMAVSAQPMVGIMGNAKAKTAKIIPAMPICFPPNAGRLFSGQV